MTFSPAEEETWTPLEEVYLLFKCHDCSLSITGDTNICQNHIITL